MSRRIRIISILLLLSFSGFVAFSQLRSQQREFLAQETKDAIQDERLRNMDDRITINTTSIRRMSDDMQDLRHAVDRLNWTAVGFGSAISVLMGIDVLLRNFRQRSQ